MIGIVATAALTAIGSYGVGHLARRDAAEAADAAAAIAAVEQAAALATAAVPTATPFSPVDLALTGRSLVPAEPSSSSRFGVNRTVEQAPVLSFPPTPAPTTDSGSIGRSPLFGGPGAQQSQTADPVEIVDIVENVDGQVVVRFSRPVRMAGEAFLETDVGISLQLTQASMSDALSVDGARILVFDRSYIRESFTVTGWDRRTEWRLEDASEVDAAHEFEPLTVGTLIRDEPPTPTPIPQAGHLAVDAVPMVLAAVNDLRARHEVGPLELGNNPAPMRHAQSSLEACISGHWDVHGLKPYQRYALTGGMQYVEENWGGTTSYCVGAYDERAYTYSSLEDIHLAAGNLVHNMERSPRHLESLLDPHARTLNVGVAHDVYNFKVSLLLERDMIEPNPAGLFTLDGGGRISINGTLRGGASLDRRGEVWVMYDPFPTPITRGQAARTSCYTVGEVLLAKISTRGSGQELRGIDQPWCPLPYDIDPALPAPANVDQGLTFYQAAEEQASMVKRSTWYVAATTWNVSNDTFHITADIASALPLTGRYCDARVCPGVYTVQLRGLAPNGAEAVVAQHSLWLGGRPSDAVYALYTEAIPAQEVQVSSPG